jgi:putative Ca2+/H+ antiporter (TMEM165/GDT1 family)
MDPKLFATVFTTVLLAEMGDKTQLATMLYAADVKNGKWTVFAASAAALILVTALAIAAGKVLGDHVPARTMKWVAGLGFVAVGVWTLWKA